jgi:hypothetical protein
MSEKRKELESEGVDPAHQRKVQGALYAEEVKVNNRGLLQTWFRVDLPSCS